MCVQQTEEIAEMTHLTHVEFTLAVSGIMFGTVFICVVAALAMTAITDSRRILRLSPRPSATLRFGFDAPHETRRGATAPIRITPPSPTASDCTLER
jgi:hypothetical protein